MGILELLLIGGELVYGRLCGVAVSGIEHAALNWRHASVIALFFGGFQALMPVIGWLLISVCRYIQSFDHWVAFSPVADHRRKYGAGGVCTGGGSGGRLFC